MPDVTIWRISDAARWRVSVFYSVFQRQLPHLLPWESRYFTLFTFEAFRSGKTLLNSLIWSQFWRKKTHNNNNNNTEPSFWHFMDGKQPLVSTLFRFVVPATKFGNYCLQMVTFPTKSAKLRNHCSILFLPNFIFFVTDGS